MEASFSESFISRLYNSISEDHYFAESVPALSVNESELVCGIMQMLQGFSSSLFYWDSNKQEFCVKSGIYSLHLSHASLHLVLDQFVFSGTCLKLVELFIKKVESTHEGIPTLGAFAGCIASWLKKIRDVSLEEEIKSVRSSSEVTSTLLYLCNSLSSVCSGAECLLKIVYEAVPCSYFTSEPPFPAAEFSTHILDQLFLKLNEASLVQDGEEAAYHMLLVIFTGTLLPYLDGLHSWLCYGTLDDPYEEMFFYANQTVSVGHPEFWEKSYVYRKKWQKQLSPSMSVPGKSEISGKRALSIAPRGSYEDTSDEVCCPLFLMDKAKAIVSAGKSLQLVQHVHSDYCSTLKVDNKYSNDILEKDRYSTDFSPISNMIHEEKSGCEYSSSCKLETEKINTDEVDDLATIHHQQTFYNDSMRMLSLSEIFLICLVGLVGDGRNIHQSLVNYCTFPQVRSICQADKQEQCAEIGNSESFLQDISTNWFMFMVDVLAKKSRSAYKPKEFAYKNFQMMRNEKSIVRADSKEWLNDDVFQRNQNFVGPSFFPEYPVFPMCRNYFVNKDCLNDLNISRNSQLPPLNDEALRDAIFCDNTNSVTTADQQKIGSFLMPNQTNFIHNQFGHSYQPDIVETLETLFPFPTILPCFKENISLSNLIPFQRNSTLASYVLSWIKSFKPKIMPLPAVIVGECLTVYIKKQVDHVGKNILLKFINDWRLMDELGVLRAIYLLGSGNLLQQFLTLIFDKLDKGESLDDDFELNTMLQASIRNSTDGRMLCAPDSLVVSIIKSDMSNDETHVTEAAPVPRKMYNLGFGINALDILKFTYKVSWPLDLIINMEALKKYNQVMGFLLKIKHAKYALDKARRWMWKCRGRMTHNHKHHLLVEQKLLHFVDAFHQYVMDRVLHSAWLELRNGMASACTLDEVIEAHESYLLSIQRQCFVYPDKLWALIASRVKIILALALEFYSIQHTLVSGGAGTAIKARCEIEVDRIEKQFDDCMVFLLRILSFKLNVGHFPHLADLVTRINFNYFYMSDNGSLLMVPNFETTAKLAKPSGRTDS